MTIHARTRELMRRWGMVDKLAEASPGRDRGSGDRACDEHFIAASWRRAWHHESPAVIAPVMSISLRRLGCRRLLLAIYIAVTIPCRSFRPVSAYTTRPLVNDAR